MTSRHHMTSHDSSSHLEPDDVASNHNSDALNEISDDMDERSPHIDVLITLSCLFLVFAGLYCCRIILIVERGGEEGGKEMREGRRVGREGE